MRWCKTTKHAPERPNIRPLCIVAPYTETAVRFLFVSLLVSINLTTKTTQKNTHTNMASWQTTHTTTAGWIGRDIWANAMRNYVFINAFIDALLICFITFAGRIYLSAVWRASELTLCEIHSANDVRARADATNGRKPHAIICDVNTHFWHHMARKRRVRARGCSTVARAV